MTQYWEPGTQYNYDDVVEYEGSRYKIIQPHRSQSDWTPPVTPALWGRLSGGDSCCQQKSEGCHGQQPQQCQQSSGGDQYSNNQGEEKHGWLQDEKHKKELEIGAGVAAGAAALAGGAYAYKHHHGQEGGEAPEESRGEKIKDWAEGHKKELEIGAGLAGVAALAGGAYAYKKHHDNQGNQGYAPEESEGEKVKDWAHDHKKGLEVGGGLLAGAATLAAGAYAYKQHEEHKREYRNDDE